ncbi:MAG: hypothetical protein ABII93_02280 [Chrysiogenia bacterium]
MGLFDKWLGTKQAPEIPSPEEIQKLAFSWNTGKLAKLMKHPDTGVRKSVIEWVTMVGKTRSAGNNQFHFNSENRLAHPMAKFLVEHVNDSDPAVREAILKVLENSGIPDVENVVKMARAKEAKAT